MSDSDAIAKQAREALKQVIDPELGINMVALGLLYHIYPHFDQGKLTNIHVVMTLTTPGCPLGGYFLEQVAGVLSYQFKLESEDIRVEIVFDPPWTQDMMDEEAMADLGLD